MSEPRELIGLVERDAALPSGDDERFAGYGVMGLTFSSGHVLALRRFPAISIGQGYTSVWHRNPEGAWKFYSTSPLQQSCNRYFGSAVAEARVTDIQISWTGPRSFTVEIEGGNELKWDVNVVGTAATRIMNAMGRMLPAPLWRRAAVLSLMEVVASRMLQVGRVRLHGTAPNGQGFVANPHVIWSVPSSSATVAGNDLGPIGPLQEQARIGEFWIPQRGLFVIGSTIFEAFDATHHLSLVTESGEE